jgi:hypothetical protein
VVSAPIRESTSTGSTRGLIKVSDLSRDPLIHGIDHGDGSLSRSHGTDIDLIRSALAENLDKDHLLGHHFQDIVFNILNIRFF